MTFDEAFERLIGHEGGYVNHPAGWLEYVNESTHESRSRIRVGDAEGASGCAAKPYARSGIDIRSAEELASVRLYRPGLCSPGLCQEPLQRALHTRSGRIASFCSCSSEEARRCLCGVRRADFRQRRLGLVPKALQAGSLRNAQGRSRRGVWFKVRSLRWEVPSRNLRFSSSWRQERISERNALKQVLERACQGIGQVHSSVRQLPQAGASR